MHEWALAESILTTVIETANKEKLKKIKEINISIGELQQLEIDIFKFAFDEILKLKGKNLKGVKTIITTEKSILKCKNCENPLRNIRNNLEKNPSTPPKTNYCEHCGKNNTKIVLHHNHATGEFVRWACVNCNSRFVHDTLEEHIKDAERWYDK